MFASCQAEMICFRGKIQEWQTRRRERKSGSEWKVRRANEVKREGKGKARRELRGRRGDCLKYTVIIKGSVCVGNGG